MANPRLDTQFQKEIYSKFRKLSDRFGPWQVWNSFVTLSACSISGREKEFSEASKSYDVEELQQFAEMFALTVDALEANPDQDFLGDLFMRFELGNAWKGQFFTPYSVCRCMASITCNIENELKERYWTTAHDPACGAGATLIAHANECRRRGTNYQTKVLYVGQDIDRTAALMCYVQLSLLGCPGYIVIGDTLCNPLVGRLLNPVQQNGQDIWYTPMFYRDIWQIRRTLEVIKQID